jgi:predicted chitinase
VTEPPPPPPPPPLPEGSGDVPLSAQQLQQIMPNLKPARLAAYFPFLVGAMQEFQINTPLRAAAFIAQLAHESAELRFMEEIASGAAYEGRKDLGNTQPGDGRRYKGRGPIQLTGRANYRKFGQLLGLDLENNPTQAATPEVGFRIAGLYWQRNGLNELADQQKFITITKRINGGTNGLADREKYYDRAKRVLGVGATRGIGGPSGEDRGAALAEPAERGFTRGLDQPGEVTPTAAERNASEGAAKAQAAKGPARKSAARKTAAKKAPAKKAAAKKASATKGAGKAAAKKAPAKKTAAKKSAAKPAAKKSAKKSVKGAGKKGGAKKTAAKKSAAGAAKRGAKKSAKRGTRGR